MPTVPLACPRCRTAIPPGPAAACPGCGAAVPAADDDVFASSVLDFAPHADTEPTAKAPTGTDDGDPFAGVFRPPEADDEVGRLAHFRVLGLLGMGGMGAVFKAHDPKLGRVVALKVMLPQAAANPEARRRFLREARSQAAVEHEHVVPIFDTGENNGVPFLAMPLLKGQPLSAALKQAPRPPAPEVLRIGREVAEGLAAAHDRGLVHRDVKPGNVWLEGAKRRVKLLDFGLARGGAAEPDDDAGQTSQGVMVGTPAYMSPEQGLGQPVDARTDLFSLGVVLYQMATGELPFQGPDTMAILMALATDTPPPAVRKNPFVPPALSDLIARLLQKRPADRPASAEAVADELARIEVSLSQTARAAATADPWAALGAAESAVVPQAVARHEPPVAEVEATTGGRTWVVAGLGLLVLLAAGGAAAFLAFAPAGTPAETAATGKEVPKPPPVRKDPPAPVVVDLLAAADPARDAVRGRWERVGADLIARGDATGDPVLELPYRPPAEYDVVAEFSRYTGSKSVSVLAVGGGRAFEFTLSGGPAGDRYGFHSVRGKRMDDDPATLRKDLKLTNGRRHTARVEVRAGKVAGYLDGKLIQEVTADYPHLALLPTATPRNPTLLGLRTAKDVTATFYRVAVTEVTGRGSLIRGTAGKP